MILNKIINDLEVQQKKERTLLRNIDITSEVMDINENKVSLKLIMR